MTASTSCRWSTMVGYRLEELRSRDARRPQFTNDDPRRLVRQFGRVTERGSGGQSEGQRADDRVSRPGDIEDLPGARRDMVNRPFLFKKAHAVLTAGHENGIGVDLFEQPLAQRFDIFIAAQGMD